jgi:hypothetical protein
MVDEIENKKVAVDDVKETGEIKPTISALELLGGAAAAAATQVEGKAFPKDLVGKLEITGKEYGDKLKDLLGDKAINQIKDRPLTKTEQLILNNMESAIKSGSLDKVQDMLSTLAENPKAVDRVLRELNNRMQKDNWLNSARWEQGTDSNGNSFVRLHLNHTDSASKSSGGTEITIGSDGRHSATRRELWNSPAEYVDPAKAMHIFSQKEQFLPYYENSQYKKS